MPLKMLSLQKGQGMSLWDMCKGSLGNKSMSPLCCLCNICRLYRMIQWQKGKHLILVSKTSVFAASPQRVYYNTISYVLFCECMMLELFSEVNNLTGKELQHVTHTPGARRKPQISVFPPPAPHSEASSGTHFVQIPCGKSSESRRRHFYKGLPADMQATQENMFPSCSCV